MLHSLLELTKTLDEFHQSSYQELHDKMACTALEQMKQSSQNASDYVTSWTNAFTQEHCSYSSVSDKSEETVFSEMYKSLIHSSALETLLQLENTYALAMDDAVTKKESAIKTMEEKYVLEPFHSCFPKTENQVDCKSWLYVFHKKYSLIKSYLCKAIWWGKFNNKNCQIIPKVIGNKIICHLRNYRVNFIREYFFNNSYMFVS